MTYYKATRLDGTDFFSGRIDYAAACGTGEVVRPHFYYGVPRLCGPGYLHAADVPAETLVGGGTWPCRLFEVEGEPVVGFSPAFSHKGGFLELRVLRELPAWQALGPNGEQVAALIERAGLLTAEEAEALHTAWVAWKGAVWVAAWDAACNSAAARDAARAAAKAATTKAGAAAADAAIALVVRDVLAPEHFDVLYGPWRDVIGEAANGCWKCIGCGRFLPRNNGWNQCSDCDTREAGDG